MTVAGEFYPQPKWARPISEIGSGLWPTPAVHDAPDRTQFTPVQTSNGTIRHLNKAGSQNRASLSQVVKMWATPQARDYRTGEAHRWKDDRRSNNLNDQVAFFATPRASDANGSKIPPNKQGGLGLNQQVSGKLNPEFVEWLQNWPRGWTALTPLPRERFDEWLHSDWWAEEPADMSRLTDSVPNRTKRIMALGNGQVSRCAAVAWLLLTQEEGDE